MEYTIGHIYEDYQKAQGFTEVQDDGQVIGYMPTDYTNSRKKIKFNKDFIVSQVESQKLTDSSGNDLTPQGKDTTGAKISRLLAKSNIISMVALAQAEVDYDSFALMQLLLENKPINALHTHSYGFHTANGRSLIERMQETYYTELQFYVD